MLLPSPNVGVQNSIKNILLTFLINKNSKSNKKNNLFGLDLIVHLLSVVSML